MALKIIIHFSLSISDCLKNLRNPIIKYLASVDDITGTTYNVENYDKIPFPSFFFYAKIIYIYLY